MGIVALMKIASKLLIWLVASKPELTPDRREFHLSIILVTEH